MDDDLYSDALRQVLAGNCTPAHVRRIEAGAGSAELWKSLEESGFCDALVPEAQGGAGLRLPDAFELMALAGEHALPLPFALTLLLRPWIVQAGGEGGAGSLTLACDARRFGGGGIVAEGVPYGLVADRVVVVIDGRAQMLDAAAAERTATGVYGSLDADLTWNTEAMGTEWVVFEDARAVGALACAAQMAGAMRAVLDRSIGYANDRKQFGKPIGKFQAIQHQLSVLACEAHASRMAAQLGCAADGTTPHALRAAIAKARCSEAAATVAAIAHAVHGAIGITEEYDLHLHTRRLHEWRIAYGSESYWNHEVGRRLVDGSSELLPFLREQVFADMSADAPA
jgi:acyl-CoA dehydrogenase